METLLIWNNHSMCFDWSLLRNCSPMQPCWYLKYPLSYRNLEEMMQERGLDICHTTIYRWVLEYSPKLNRGLRKYLKPTTGRKFHLLLA